MFDIVFFFKKRLLCFFGGQCYVNVFYLVNGVGLSPTVEMSSTVQWDQHEKQNKGRGLPGNVETS